MVLKYGVVKNMTLLRTVRWLIVKALIRLQFPQVRSLTIAALADWLQHPDPPLLLDARTAAEYQVSHLADAQRVPEHIDQLLEQLKQKATPDLTQTPIVVYCSVGYRSAKLARTLQTMGFNPVFNLEGSIFEWANAGYPVYRAGTVVRQVHPYNASWGKLLQPELRFEIPAQNDAKNYSTANSTANSTATRDSDPVPSKENAGDTGCN